MKRYSRRLALASIGTAALAGCLSGPERSSDEANQPSAADGNEPTADADGDDDSPDDRVTEPLVGAGVVDDPPDVEPGVVPTMSVDLPLPADPETMEGSMRRGAPKDAIPAIDDPVYADADDAPDRLEPGDPVFGIVGQEEARAYPQHILVWHEIVNGELDGHGVSITYCPLTGTAQGFFRSDVTFGVSGMLLNSNLIMYDRTSSSYWPQMLAAGIKGDHTSDELVEFNLVWTEWERWRNAYPDTRVLTEDTGYARDYDRDPYGAYNPPSGHYADDSLLFPPFQDGNERDAPPKEVVIGARTADGAMAAPKETLAEEGVLSGEVGGVEYAMVYDETLHTGWCYRIGDSTDITYADGTPEVDGTAYPPDGLPLEDVVRYDAMWFAWEGYYPETAILT